MNAAEVSGVAEEMQSLACNEGGEGGGGDEDGVWA